MHVVLCVILHLNISYNNVLVVVNVIMYSLNLLNIQQWDDVICWNFNKYVLILEEEFGECVL